MIDRMWNTLAGLAFAALVAAFGAFHVLLLLHLGAAALWVGGAIVLGVVLTAYAFYVAYTGKWPDDASPRW